MAARLGRGEDVDAGERLFHATTRIETAAPHLDWLNKGVFVTVTGRTAVNMLYETYLVGEHHRAPAEQFPASQAIYEVHTLLVARPTPATAWALLGRDAEFASLDRMLDDARRVAAACWWFAASQGSANRRCWTTGRTGEGMSARPRCGREYEAELTLAGLQQLLGASIHSAHSTFPAHSATPSESPSACNKARRRTASSWALATLGVLCDMAEDGTLVCLIDDAQWLDRASIQVLAFIGRRLGAERFALVFAVREPSAVQELDGLPELVVEGLGDHDARSLLAWAVAGRLDDQVRDRIVAETRGNPLALLELPRSLTPAEMAGGFGLPDARTLSGRVQQSFLRRIESLPEEAREVLFVAAAEPVGDVTMLMRALDTLGIAADNIVSAENEGLIELGSRVHFPHPFVRSAAYRAATPEVRRRGHAALAEATDP